jgi:hypothetical protein
MMTYLKKDGRVKVFRFEKQTLIHPLKSSSLRIELFAWLVWEQSKGKVCLRDITNEGFNSDFMTVKMMTIYYPTDCYYHVECCLKRGNEIMSCRALKGERKAGIDVSEKVKPYRSLN